MDLRWSDQMPQTGPGGHGIEEIPKNGPGPAVPRPGFVQGDGNGDFGSSEGEKPPDPDLEIC